MKRKTSDPATGPIHLKSRREVLKGLAAGSVAAAAPLFPALGRAESKDPGSAAWAMEADLVIVGSGIAGTSAALAATSQGASVILLEKMPFKGGTTAKSGGVFWIPDNPLMQSQGIADDRTDLLRYLVRLSHPSRYAESEPLLGLTQAEFDMLAAFYDNAGKVVATLAASTGLEPMPWYSWDMQPFPDYYAQIPENKVQRGRALVTKSTGGSEGFVWPGNGGAGVSLLNALQQNFDKLPIQMLLEHRVLDVIRNAQGEVIGVSVDRGDPQPIRVRARKAVMFATGGFTHNIEMARNHLKGHIWGGCAAPGSTGDFVDIARRAGANLGNMQNAWWGQIPVEAALKTRSVAADIWSTPGDSMIQVNRHGKRFVNEKIQYDERTQAHFYWDPVHAEYPNLLGFMIYDARTAGLYAGYDPIPAANTTSPYVIEGANLDELATNLDARLAKLAAQTGGVKLHEDFRKNLRASIAGYNKSAKKGVDPEFARGEAPIERAFQFMAVKKVENPYSNMCMHPIAGKGPYHAIILGAGTLDTKGGAVVNPNGQVLDVQNRPIPGLYAAGNCTAHPAAQAYWAGGSTIGSAMTFGYLAGTAASGEALKPA